MATGIVTFDYILWAARYPELSAFVSQPLAQAFFNEATLYCDNTPTSIVQDVVRRSTLLNMLTAHIAQLNAALGAPSSQLVGRISSAGQGSVNVSTEMNFPPGSSQWFNQTKYGAAFWAATMQERTMRYVPGSVNRANPFTQQITIVGRS